MSSQPMQLPAILQDRFAAQQLLANGRMSRVLKATERKSGRTVALKILHAHLGDHDAICARLRRELAATKRLNHDAIVEVEEWIEGDGVTALVMEWVDGPSVRTRVQEQGTLSWPNARAILADILQALQQAHERGIWHRDLCAEHVLLGPEGAKITGFGMARVDELVGLTMHTGVLGALEAMAPERILGMSYDGRADLYSVGAVAYELLVGYPPADGRMSQAFEQAAVESSPVVDIPSDLPRAARYVLERSLVGDPGARFATADQMRRALEGEYDVQMWRNWTARTPRRCRQCQTPLFEGVDSCIECGHRLRRLVQEPARGSWMIRIVSADVEPSGEADAGLLERLMELLAHYDDTRPFADGRWEYRLPPYVLLSDLTRDDADRVADELEARAISHEVVRHLPGLWARLFSEEGKSTTFLKLAGVSILVMIFGFGTGWGIGESVMWLAAGGFLLSLFVAQMVTVEIKRRLGSTRNSRRHKGHAFMIPTEELASPQLICEEQYLPDGASKVLSDLGDGVVYRELLELIDLAAELVPKLDKDSRLELQSVIQDLFFIGQRLDEALRRQQKITAAEQIKNLERLQFQLEAAEASSERARLVEDRKNHLDTMERLDQLTFEVDLLKARLLSARGTLLDLRSEDHLEERAGGQLSELRHQLEAAMEVEALVEQEATP